MQVLGSSALPGLLSSLLMMKTGNQPDNFVSFEVCLFLSSKNGGFCVLLTKWELRWNPLFNSLCSIPGTNSVEEFIVEVKRSCCLAFLFLCIYLSWCILGCSR